MKYEFWISCNKKHMWNISWELVNFLFHVKWLLHSFHIPLAFLQFSPCFFFLLSKIFRKSKISCLSCLIMLLGRIVLNDTPFCIAVFTFLIRKSTKPSSVFGLSLRFLYSMLKLSLLPPATLYYFFIKLRYSPFLQHTHSFMQISDIDLPYIVIFPI